VSLKILPSCIGCGACEFACPPRAISQGENFVVQYQIDPFKCDDCNRCVSVCPVYAIVEDPEWAQCYKRGCPLSSKRYEGWECTLSEMPCDKCGFPLWKSPTGSLICSNCESHSEKPMAVCPKKRKISLKSRQTKEAEVSLKVTIS
jgi:ferredoxin